MDPDLRGHRRESPRRIAAMRLSLLCTLLCVGLAIGCAQHSLGSSATSPSGEPEARIGTIVFPTSGSGEAQEHFLRGVTILHSFGWKQAIAEFRRAQAIDPDFAMAYWGEALCYNHPLFPTQDLVKPREVLARLGATPEEREAKAPTAREKGFLRAVEALFADEGDVASRKIAHRDAMRRLYEQHPDDPEVAAFTSLAIQQVAYLDFPNTVAERVEAGAIALEVFARNPDHPGAAHYTIHAFDDPMHAVLALPAANRFAEIAAAVSHARHMPSHIYIQRGMWERVSQSNDDAFAVAEALWEPGDAPNDLVHSLDWGQYGDLQRGDLEKAQRWIAKMEALAEKLGDNPFAAMVLPQVKARFVIETEQWQVLPVTESSPAPELLATGLSAIRTDDVGTAERARDRLAVLAEEAASRPPSRMLRSEIIAIAHLELAALVALERGDEEQALAHLAEGVSLAEALGAPRGAAQPIKPVHELGGEMHLQLGDLAAAEELFTASLERTPNRPRSLLGLARTYAAQGRRELAVEQYAKLAGVWAGRPALPELEEARRYLAGS